MPVTGPLSITLVRHGATAWSESHQHTSWTDLPLNAQGRHEAELLGPALANTPYDGVYCSPLRRARETARCAGFESPQIESDLGEWSYGAYEGRTAAAIEQECPGWMIYRDGAPGGESPMQVAARCDHLLALWKQRGHRHVLCFSHGHLLRVLAIRWIGQDILLGAHLSLDPASISRMGWEHERPAFNIWNAGLRVPDLRPFYHRYITA